MQVFFFGALFLSVLIATAHSDKGNSSIPGQILDHLPKRKISPLIDKFTIDYQILAKGEQSSLPAQIFEYLTAQLYYSQLELFNSDLKIDEIFRNIFQAVKELFLQNRLVLVNYLLYSSRNEGAKVLQFNKTSLEESGFDSSLDTKILIHGYTVELLNTSIYFDIIDKLLLSGNYNVILVDWTDYNQAPYYCAVGYAYLVGLDLANLIGFLLVRYSVTCTV
ncbi:hypothetical protein JTE90_015300 [Oedothorax gibbosus]|uniref:Lipase domain-containing protein n=1 Tax=Oedothorax gibbosus TaxID=931172 RepID=A0AAV6VQ63_9ARAC|nr:hypothetical protein JTE90_015300 [Oedothorax gibbosus]